MKNLLTACCFLLFSYAFAQTKVDFEDNKTPEHHELISTYELLSKKHEAAKLYEYGKTDCGRPLHLFVIDPNKTFHKDGNEVVVLVNNAIHPGEPCGVDASLELSRKLLENKKQLRKMKNTILCIIPMYNVGGALNRSCCSRANQNGPENYGFRGNARHLDLNRDFIKMDSENSHAFIKIYQDWDPDIFIDTHTSNGADYQYVMTLITSQKDKLGKELGNFLTNDMEPALYKAMEKSYPMIPYVHTTGRTPRDGIMDYLETPRYSTGYAALFHSIAFVSEAHMFKPYKDRVAATYDFLWENLIYASKNQEKIKQVRKQAKQNSIQKEWFPINWSLDKSRSKTITFKGFQEYFTTSELTGHERLHYNREEPVSYEIPYFSYYNTTDSVKAPKAYIIPQSWKEVIARLKANKIHMKRLQSDSTLSVQSYYIEKLETSNKPYEGHFYHKAFETSIKKQKIHYLKGDYIIPTDQPSKRFIIEVLEPRAVDSYFRWNFFDEILQQKEWFSDYIFEEKAIEILANNPAIKKAFEQEKKNNPDFSKSHWAQLYFIYKLSPYYEDEHMRYPVGRIE